MGEIARSKRQITLFYNSDSPRARQTIAYAEAEGLDVQLVDILKTPMTGTQIAELASRLGLQIKDLVNQEHKAYSSEFEPHVLSAEDWITMIRQNPEIMKQPIALHGDRTLLIETPSDMLNL
jgi:arsenate reductase (glutaredoxin)